MQSRHTGRSTAPVKASLAADFNCDLEENDEEDDEDESSDDEEYESDHEDGSSLDSAAKSPVKPSKSAKSPVQPSKVCNMWVIEIAVFVCMFGYALAWICFRSLERLYYQAWFMTQSINMALSTAFCLQGSKPVENVAAPKQDSAAKKLTSAQAANPDNNAQSKVCNM